MLKKAAGKMAVVSTMLLLVPLVSSSIGGRGTAQAAASTVGNPEILKAIKQLQSSVDALQGSVNQLPKKRFYQTKSSSFDGSQPLTACEAGFHMASMWEILDPSNLQYDSARGFVEDDSGSGPPANREGWIRTGRSAGVSGAAGVNCDVWTSNTDEGTVAELDWAETSGTFPWDARDDGCNQLHPVWCVQD